MIKRANLDNGSTKATSFDRAAVSFFSGVTALLLSSVLWWLIVCDWGVIDIPYRFVVIASAVMAILGGFLRQNFIANTFGALMRLIAAMAE